MNKYYEYIGEMPTEVIMQLVEQGVPFDFDPACHTITLRHVTDSEVQAFETACREHKAQLGYSCNAHYIIQHRNNH